MSVYQRKIRLKHSRKQKKRFPGLIWYIRNNKELPQPYKNNGAWDADSFNKWGWELFGEPAKIIN